MSPVDRITGIAMMVASALHHVGAAEQRDELAHRRARHLRQGRAPPPARTWARCGPPRRAEGLDHLVGEREHVQPSGASQTPKVTCQKCPFGEGFLRVLGPISPF